MRDTDRVIITAQPEAAAVALHEVQTADPAARPLASLSPEARLVSVPGGYFALRENFNTVPPVFIRHLFPVQYAGDAADWQYDDWKTDGGAFSVQARAFPGEKPLDVIRECEAALIQRGYTQDDKHPVWALSLFFHHATLYAGLSRTADNRSAWNGGAARYKKDVRFISRAEFKLLEALDTADLRLPASFTALDLGAAPGGWSKVLLERGGQVTAVDPAALDERLTGWPGLTVIRSAAQRLKRPDKPYDLIVNDMRMDMLDSARIMLAVSEWLRRGGAAIMTLKLTQGHWHQKTQKALALLRQKYRIRAARQLFHNRDEVTIFLDYI